MQPGQYRSAKDVLLLGLGKEALQQPNGQRPTRLMNHRSPLSAPPPRKSFQDNLLKNIRVRTVTREYRTRDALVFGASTDPVAQIECATAAGFLARVVDNLDRRLDAELCIVGRSIFLRRRGRVDAALGSRCGAWQGRHHDCGRWRHRWPFGCRRCRDAYHSRSLRFSGAQEKAGPDHAEPNEQAR